MTWTRERPTQAGWYWVRWPKQPQYGPEIVLIEQPHGPDTDYLEIHDVPLHEYIDAEGGVEWQGPLEPEEGRWRMSDLEKGCHRSHPHENMDVVCQLKTTVARLAFDLRSMTKSRDAWMRRAQRRDMECRGWTQEQIENYMRED